MTEGLTQAERSVLEPPYHPRLDRPSLQVGISHFHIPPTDCPYNADIYFVTISRVLFGETKDWSWEMAAGACVALGGFGVYSFAKLKAMARKG
jgi:hypothetical protein